MVTLYERLPDRVRVGGRTYRIHPEFDRVLEAFDTFSHPWDNAEKVDYACWLLIRGRPPDKAAALNAVYDLLIEPKRASGQKTFDFVQDAPLIYAAFMQAYHIDLYNERLHWWKFIALLNALPSSTRFAEVVGIRTRPVPKATKHNQEQIGELMKAKAQYALHLSAEEREAQLQAGLAKLVQSIVG